MVLQSQDSAFQPPPAESLADVGNIHLHGRILFAEDGLDNQRLISMLLEKAGADVTTCENGQFAVEAAIASMDAGKPFDMIIMDMQMPVMDGYIATRQMREMGYTGPIIALTAHAMAEDRQKCLDAGCDEYLTKPFDRTLLLATIARYIREKCCISDRGDKNNIRSLRGAMCLEPAPRSRPSREDTPDIQNLVAELLADAGAEVMAVENGQLAVEKALYARCNGNPFDLILMDMQMPVMDGYQATRQLRNEGYQGRIIALTAHSMKWDRQKCLESGCDDFLTKPLDPDRLIMIVAESATASRAENNAMQSEFAAFPPPGAEDVLHSQYADTPVIARRLGKFVSRLDGRVQAMKAAIDNSQADELRRLAHQLKGSAGSYGYPSLSEAAKALEEAAKLGRLDAASKILDHVAALGRAIVKRWEPSQTANPTGSALLEQADNSTTVNLTQARE